jgi:1-acyl-sn-glycerol-3-phosphate acyltransferase
MGACIENAMIPAAIDRPAEATHSPECHGALGDDVSQTWSEQSDGWRHQLAGAADYVLRRVSGDYQADETGFDPEFNSSVLMPVARVLYRNWFRVRMRGLGQVPASGPALIVANHSGVLPFDAVMLQTGVFNEHPAHRNLRLLGADLVYAVPVLANLARMSGHTRACPQEADRLLRAGELVGVFPEGFKGIGKPFSERYRLQRFGRGGFAVTAIKAGVPIIPCAIVGAEEIYPMIGNSEPVARLFRLPYFPVTPLFPWLGPVGAIPLPSNWIIEFCEPVPTEHLRADWQHHPDTVSSLADQVKRTIQLKLDELRVERGPAFS